MIVNARTSRIFLMPHRATSGHRFFSLLTRPETFIDRVIYPRDNLGPDGPQCNARVRAVTRGKSFGNSSHAGPGTSAIWEILRSMRPLLLGASTALSSRANVHSAIIPQNTPVADPVPLSVEHTTARRGKSDVQCTERVDHVCIALVP